MGNNCSHGRGIAVQPHLGRATKDAARVGTHIQRRAAYRLHFRSHEAGNKAWETIAAMAEASLSNLISAGLLKTPLELERTYKGVRLTASISDLTRPAIRHGKQLQPWQRHRCPTSSRQGY